ncbi:3-keto-5-aminohexanoate cleavage protein [Actinocorallia sp. A-T 12471]|uniref:3-keto-5-aminohexanoate cleavage protein n=1 Tax=Actinocorallia sp. A-T 12471 TaxID=3089813 RepID=UPI0029CEF5DF|nr:3-keto-5-aminohexanoate cleavage protein [Actinocorallia sp. A-T 12471]MDX6740210.1 3-keto-5-aminohexanoate cleavage protein [Actinocorallia sp. A-T 12471]
MKKTKKVIISCAVTGSAHTPSMSDYLPVTPDEIATQAIDAAQAGAAIVHLHARDPRTGEPTADPAVFKQFLPRIKEGTDAVVNITTGGSTTMTIDDRLAAARWAQPELASMNMGSMNFGVFPAADVERVWKHEWELKYLRATESAIFANTFAQIATTLRELGDGAGTRFEYECYDVGHLYNLAHMVDRGLAKPPFLVQCIFGILGGIGADPDNLQHMVTVADRLFGDDYHLSAFAAGRHQFPFATRSALHGGHVRVGLEDSLYIGRGELATSNAQQVAKMALILTELGKEIATPDEARAMLGLKGAENVNF